ncbi:hypothetical protein RJT34_28657 [Clitoria ternatea]|uniref:Uncharacterized protein n=1 Tax=Clitoria ternatea TaxID=43366 RepID=A0AAN9ICP5_CLITE
MEPIRLNPFLVKPLSISSLLLPLQSLFASSYPSFESSENRLCNHFVLAPTIPFDDGIVRDVANELRVQSSYFVGGDRLFN